MSRMSSLNPRMQVVTAAEVAMAVDDSMQGKGLGTVLLERLALLAVRNGFSQFWALTQSDNLAMNLSERDLQVISARVSDMLVPFCLFDTENGELLLGREGGHSHRRIVHALGDATGHEIMRAMIAQAQNKLDAEIWPNTFTIDLLTDEGRCRGALVWNPSHGKTIFEYYAAKRGVDIEERGAVEGARATPRGVITEAPKPRESAREASDRKRREAEERNARHRRTRELRTLLSEADASAVAADRELAEVTERLADPTTYADASAVRALVDRHNALRDRVDGLARERERLEGLLEVADAESVPLGR